MRRLVHERAQGRCEYCRTSEWLTGLPCEVDHINPQAKGGTTTDDNLCLACASCNGYKQARIRATDPESGEKVRCSIPAGNNGMATAGSGDILTGLITGFLAQGLKPSDGGVSQIGHSLSERQTCY